mgnify:CR=1 FL=1|tara:strand:- start:2456 stop:4033 length:1578 start_codon:yes stop_codon:yes gene_type:complete
MASTQADSTLTSGAYAAAGGNIENYGLAAAKGLTDIAKDTTDQLTPVLKERRDRFEKFADHELARQPGTLSDADYKNLEKDLNRRRRRFVWLGKKDRQMLMRELEVEEQEQLKLDNVKQNIAKKTKKNGKGINDNYVNGEGTEVIDELENGVETNGDGQKGVYVNKKKPCDGTFGDCFKKNRDMNIEQHGMDFDKWTNFLWAGSRSDSDDGVVTEYHPYQQDDLDGKTHTSAATLGNSQAYKGQWKSLDQVNKDIDENSYDQVSNDVITTAVDNSMQESQSVMPGENGVFNYDFEERKYKNIVNKGNVASLTTQEHIPGRIFKDDLVEMLSNNTYESLGIKNRKVKRFDPTPDTPVTPEDAMVIADNLLKNERLTKKYLTTYFTNYAEQNWIQAAKNRKGNDKQPPQQGGGGEPEDGVITDHDSMYDYKVVDGKWYTKNKNSDGNWININDDSKYAVSIEKLNAKYPDAGGTTAATKPSAVDENGDGKDIEEWIPSVQEGGVDLSQPSSSPGKDFAGQKSILAGF